MSDVIYRHNGTNRRERSLRASAYLLLDCQLVCIFGSMNPCGFGPEPTVTDSRKNDDRQKLLFSGNVICQVLHGYSNLFALIRK